MDNISVMGVQNLNQLWRMGEMTGQTPEIASPKPQQTFDSFLRAMVNMYNETNENIAVSQQMQLVVEQG
jgi:hypothetical protein